MKRTWTIIGVADVPRSFRFYQSLLGLAEAVPVHEEEPFVNPNTGTREFSLRDPDGYYVTISAISSA
jgi:hypothetical protein